MGRTIDLAHIAEGDQLAAHTRDLLDRIGLHLVALWEPDPEFVASESAERFDRH